MLKNQILLLAFIFTLLNGVFAQQIEYVEMGIDGVTCSLCMRTVDVALSRVKGVSHVQANIAATTVRVYAQKSSDFHIGSLVKAVGDAGFSVRFVKVYFTNPVQLNNCHQLAGGCWSWLDPNYAAVPVQQVYLVSAKLLSANRFDAWFKDTRPLAATPELAKPRSSDIRQQKRQFIQATACGGCIGDVWYITTHFDENHKG